MNTPSLAELVQLGWPSLLAQHREHLTPAHHQALLAIQHCRSGRFGLAIMRCDHCGHQQTQARSCGHRSCPQCQQHTAEQWLQRQQAKLLPVRYLLVTFTVPQQLRALMYRHQKTAYDALFAAVAETLKTFGRNHRQLNSQLGFCAVLHTHSRRLDYHPHVHVIVPGGGINVARSQWRKLQGDYLFNGRQLAAVFRAKMLAALQRAGIDTSSEALPTKWVVQCQKVGRGLPALRYLSRYLYRGVISESNIVAFDPDAQSVTFRYQDGKTKQPTYRTLPLVDFLWRLMVHVLPTGYRRVRDYGFLHGNAKRLLLLLQVLMRVVLPPAVSKQPNAFACSVCQHVMTRIGFVPGWRPT